MADMIRLQERLPKMLALARERTDEARLDLAGMLSDALMDQSSKLSLREEELINELIDELMRTRSSAVRAKLVERFANGKIMPRRIAVGLATDKIEIARNVLMHSVTLTDEDLITVVEHQSSDHAQAIAKRERISSAVADVLVVTGDVKVMQLVAENLGATLSQKAIEVLTDAARFAMELREPILKRDEMTPDAAMRLYWWVSQDLRRYALKRFGISSGQINTALASTIDQLLSYYELEKQNDHAMGQVADWLAERQVLNAEVLPQVLRLGHFRLFNIVLARLIELPIELVDKIVAETGGRGLAVICRSLGIDKPQFVSIFLLARGARSGEQVVHPRELSQALMAYDRMNVNLAQDMLHTWKADPSYFDRDALEAKDFVS